MGGIEINAKALEGLEKLSEEALAEVIQIIKAGLWEAGQYVEREVKEKTPTSYGTLRSSIAHSEPEVSDSVWQVRVGSSLSYVVPVENGSRPHWAPRQPIKMWVAQKGYSGRELEVVTSKVLWGIAKHGTKAVKMFANTYDEHKGEIEKILLKTADEVQKVLEKMNNAQQ